MQRNGDNGLPLKTGYIHDSGGTGSCIVLLHGFVASSTYWRKVVPALVALGYRVIRIDLLGFGGASKPSQSEYDYVAHVEHIKQALEKIEVHAPFTLVGHSLGALIAARYALLYPTNVQNLILLHPPLYANRRQVVDTLRSTGPHYRLLLGRPTLISRVAWKILAMAVPDISAHSERSRMLTMQRVIESAELVDDLSAVTTPTVLVVGTKDRAIYMQNLAQVSFCDAVSIEVRPWAHHSALNKPQAVARLIDRHISPKSLRYTDQFSR